MSTNKDEPEQVNDTENERSELSPFNQSRLNVLYKVIETIERDSEECDTSRDFLELLANVICTSANTALQGGNYDEVTAIWVTSNLGMNIAYCLASFLEEEIPITLKDFRELFIKEVKSDIESMRKKLEEGDEDRAAD